ncbi:OVARIAN TUMOR DOMAIN-containing deubiquitinating enzyme 7 [Teleopsis dalmanni]|uniref:OVARIAN TUMOR DOMAIN-containing deubiquitinating enzyme 7 n=1 Tax=Teleopsis dalmanni TaxID=139649 RepID=UPI0018CFB9F2|nr:OVARIAN TUMOR DOMAIN-containing deubiquitinating enzyme 7 [Teleopsis dalmanni]XP_037933290.1 OVARIAN TUMOR DOMAIN-containing deubiquitinating enzyme 7 [Teleopsis dalmanni]XP_037933291.1 OVARIAN TUMOR DOMAIN-containing deubiquitinating enzyme 7 [Teleopsis dalmanni]
MTIKPLVTTSQKRVSGDTEKESHSHASHNAVDAASSHNQQNVVVRNSAQHRNVVIDGHRKSPQRRVEVYEELSRQRRSPNKNLRSKRRDAKDLQYKRDRNEREKLTNQNSVPGKCVTPHIHNVSTAGIKNNGGNSPAHVNIGGKSPEHLGNISVLGCQNSQPQNLNQVNAKLLKKDEDKCSGYNSGDEHTQPKECNISADEWNRRDEQFAKCMVDRGYILKPVEEDGACLFRSISLQIYGDEEMHDVVRQNTMDYIYQNREYFRHFVTEDINSYIKRKRRNDSHGNHIEIQAMSEIYNRPVEVYSYKPTPINIFNSEQLKNGLAPLRLSYQRGSHYNAILDPYNATVGVGLGLAGYKPDLQTKEAARLSEQLEIEQTMFEDKLKTTDWEATNEAIEEQIARESYLQWCRDNLQKSRNVASSTAASTSATITSAEYASGTEASPSKYSNLKKSGSSSTITAATAITAGSGHNSPSCASISHNTTSLEHTMSLSSLGHNIKFEKNMCDLGFDSDDTDMSSTSSRSTNCGNDSNSPSSAARAQKNKSRGNGIRGNKKRRRERIAAALSNSNDIDKSKCDTPSVVNALQKKRSHTPEVEQQPSTSKQSSTPEKNKTNSTVSSTIKSCESNFYQELLEASYADGFGQLSESEMLRRAIQMSTEDYIEDQKRKYFYGP